VLHWQPELVEEEPINVEEEPLLASLFKPVRNAVWSTQVAARSRLQDVTMAAMTPIYRLQKRLKRR